MKQKMNLRQELDLTRDGTAEMTRWCIIIALHQCFGVGKDRLNRIELRAEELGLESLNIAMQANGKGMPSTDQSRAMRDNWIGDSFVAIVHPHTSYDIRKDPNWIEAHKYAAPEEIFNGEIGKINNVRFVVSSEAKVWKGDGCPAGLAVYSTLVLGAHAYATTELEGGGMQHIVKQLGYGDDPLNQRASVGWKATKTAERLSEQYMVRIESCSARYSAKALAN